MKYADSDQVIQCILAHRHGADDQLRLKLSIRMGKKGDLRRFK